jgi:hypothetical protein
VKAHVLYSSAARLQQVFRVMELQMGFLPLNGMGRAKGAAKVAGDGGLHSGEAGHLPAHDPAEERAGRKTVNQAFDRLLHAPRRIEYSLHGVFLSGPHSEKRTFFLWKT